MTVLFEEFDDITWSLHCCFVERTLRGKAFYEVQGKIYCEDDYLVKLRLFASVCYIAGWVTWQHCR